MRTLLRIFCVMGVLPVIVAMASPLPKAASGDDDRSVVIIFKDGHRQTFRLADIARIEFSTPTTTTHIAGKPRPFSGGVESRRRRRQLRNFPHHAETRWSCREDHGIS